jgi:phage tail-like protein
MSVVQTASLSTIATDPLRNFKFHVTITPNAGSLAGTALNLGFMNVQGLNVQIDVIAYREGGFNTTTQKMPGQADFSPIVMSRGVVMGDSNILNWARQLFIVMQGTGSQTPGTNFRSTVDIQILDHPVTSSPVPVKAWFRVYNAWPTAVSWSDLDAGANALFINQISLAHEGFSGTIASGPGTTEAGTPS